MNVNCRSLGELDDGAAAQVVDHELIRCIEDVDARGSDEKVRKCVIQVEFEKLESGEIKIVVKAQAKLPAIAARATLADVKREGRQLLLEFESDHEAGAER